MAFIQVTLSEDDIRAACMNWAVTRVLNEGCAVSCCLDVVVCEGEPTGTINSVTVNVETDRMFKALPKHIVEKERSE